MCGKNVIKLSKRSDGTKPAINAPNGSCDTQTLIEFKKSELIVLTTVPSIASGVVKKKRTCALNHLVCNVAKTTQDVAQHTTTNSVLTKSDRKMILNLLTPSVGQMISCACGARVTTQFAGYETC
jgi:hypothetical protein